MSRELREYFITHLLPAPAELFRMTALELSKLAEREPDFALRWGELVALKGGDQQAGKEHLRNSINSYLRDHPQPCAEAPGPSQLTQRVYDPKSKQIVTMAIRDYGGLSETDAGIFRAV
jgi:hypothetical protein